MKRFNRNLSVLIGCAFLCLLPLTQTLGFADEPERMPVKELKRLLDSEENVIVVDVRSERALQRGAYTGGNLYSTGAAWNAAFRTSEGGLIVFY